MVNVHSALLYSFSASLCLIRARGHVCYYKMILLFLLALFTKEFAFFKVTLLMFETKAYAGASVTMSTWLPICVFNFQGFYCSY